MCSVHGCSNVPTRKVTVVAKTVAGERTETIEVCEEHWSALNGGCSGVSMGCAPTAAYTSNAKTWWQQNSDRLGSEFTWDVFCEVWMAALKSADVAHSAFIGKPSVPLECPECGAVAGHWSTCSKNGATLPQ